MKLTRQTSINLLGASALHLMLGTWAPTSMAQIQQGSTMAMGKDAIARVQRVDVAPVIDGNLNDEVWQQANPISGFVQREPREGTPVSENTVVRLLVDREAIYVGAWLLDRSPVGIVIGEKLRDTQLDNSDYFGIVFDTYLDRQNGFVFSTTPAGIEYDGQVVKEGEGGGVFQRGQTRQQAGSMGGFNLNWDGSWQVATSMDDEGWYAEFRIPFSTLRYGGGDTQNWGMNLVRGIRRHNEESFWSPIPRQFNFMRLSMAGTLEGIPVPVRRIATLTPYALTSADKEYLVAGSNFDYHREVGLDGKFGLTPSLTLDMTLNTDFAQVEVDEQRTNLTRFPLFFPEKRTFFLENAGIFSAGTPQAVELFFSRRIGISSLGTPVPILGGGRLTGKPGGVTLGLLHIYTDDVGGIQPRNAYSVARMSKEFGERSRIGGIVVQRMATDDTDDHNRTYGVDGRLGIGDVWTVDGWAAITETPGQSGDEEAYGLLVNYRTRDWSNRGRFLQVGEGFNPEVGFLNRSAYRLYDVNIMRIVRFPNIPWLRQTNPHFTYTGYYDFDGFKESERIHFDTEFEFSGGGRLGPELNFETEGLKEDFEIAPGIIVPKDDYHTVANVWDIGSNPSAPFSVNGRLNLGGFLSGNRYGGSTTFTLRQGASLTSSLLIDYNHVDLPQGNFDVLLLRLRLGYFFTPRIYVQSLIQYSDQAEIFSANVRFGWLNTAGTGLFIVYNEAQEADGLTSLIRPVNRSLVAKFTRQLELSGL